MKREKKWNCIIIFNEKKSLGCVGEEMENGWWRSESFSFLFSYISNNWLRVSKSNKDLLSYFYLIKFDSVKNIEIYDMISIKLWIFFILTGRKESLFFHLHDRYFEGFSTKFSHHPSFYFFFCLFYRKLKLLLLVIPSHLVTQGGVSGECWMVIKFKVE